MAGADELIDFAGDDQLLDDLKGMLINAEANRPRSLQRQPGPSEVGHPCIRKLAHIHVSASKYEPTAEQRGHNRYSDPLAAMIGTGAHGVMEEAARAANDALGRVRWIPEQKVQVREGLSGTADLYDIDTHTVLDWKFPGVTRYKHYVSRGPNPTYRGQAHLYGRGYRNLGLPVESVGIIFVSRTGTLRQTHLWRETYSEELVDEILTRLDDTNRLIEELSLEINPAGFEQLPITPDGDCESTCPWFSLTPGPFGCRGLDAGRG